MSLRGARLDDHWRRILQRHYPTKVRQLTFRNLACLVDSKVTFEGGINAIVGGNGVGKSTLIAAITELVSGDLTRLTNEYRRKLKGSETEAATLSEDVESTVSVGHDASGNRTFSAELFPGHSTWLDPSELGKRCITQINSDQNFADLLESVTPLILNPSDLAVASYLVGKRYTAMEMFEINDYADFERMPYFRVTAADVTYGSESMGRGELSLLLTYWTIRDLPKNSVLVLEEPETHVSPRSQDCLMNVLAKFSDEKGLWVIVTTHSPAIIRRIPSEHLILVARADGEAVTLQNPRRGDISILLGAGTGFGGMLLVEDECAKSFLMAVLEQYAPEILRTHEVVAASSESKITAVLKNLPRTGDWFSVIGVFDGDMREKLSGSVVNWPFIFLPGKESPERELLAVTDESDFVQLLGGELQKPIEAILISLNHAAGCDPHEFFGLMASALSLSKNEVQRAFARVWLRKMSGDKSIAMFIKELLIAAQLKAA